MIPALAEVTVRMGIDFPALSPLETGKMPKHRAATLHKWAEAILFCHLFPYRNILL